MNKGYIMSKILLLYTFYLAGCSLNTDPNQTPPNINQQQDPADEKQSLPEKTENDRKNKKTEVADPILDNNPVADARYCLN
jgi:hypothetical protein